MRKLLCLAGLVVLALGCSSVSHAVANAQPSIERYLQSGTTVEAFNLDGSGNMRLAGWQTIGGSVTVTGVLVSSSGVSTASMTLAQINLLTSPAGTQVFCNNCTAAGGAGTICISTAPAVASFILSTGTVCK